MARTIGAVPGQTKRTVLEALRLVCADGWPATVREVAKAAGMSSPSSAHRYLVALEVDGLVEQHPRSESRRGGWRPVA